MTGTTAQPSHEPQHKRKGTGSRHTGQHHCRKKENIFNNNKKSLGRGRGKKMAERTSRAEKNQQ